MTTQIRPEDSPDPDEGSAVAFAGAAPEQLLDQWVGRLPYRLLLLEKALLPDEDWFDLTPVSLVALERRLLERSGALADAEERALLMESAAAYVGEVLLGVAGGAWGWNTRPVDGDPGQAVVCPDAGLGLSPVAPRLLIAYALREGTGQAFTGEVDRLRREVAGRQAQVPGWEPVKTPTPHVDPHEPLPEHPALTRWLTERHKALQEWARDTFDGAWRGNFHPETLDWLEAVVRQRFATVEEFDAARDEPFLQGACWYVGEVLRRTQGAMWQYAPFDPGAEPGALGSRQHTWTDVPFVDQPGKRLPGAAQPLACLRALLEETPPGEPEEQLSDTLFWFRPCTYAQVGAVVQRIGMAPDAKVDAVLDEFAEFAHQPLGPDGVYDALVSFGVAVSAHGDDVDDLTESYAGILEEAVALTGGAVTVTDVTLRPDEAHGEVLEFRRNGTLVSQPVDHPSDEYIDHLAVMEFIGHADPDPADDPRRFRTGDFVRLRDMNYESYYVLATDEQAAALERELGVVLY